MEQGEVGGRWEDTNREAGEGSGRGFPLGQAGGLLEGRVGHVRGQNAGYDVCACVCVGGVDWRR